MRIRENITSWQRFEFGFYQLMDHLLSRKVAFFLTGTARRYLYKRIRKSLEKSGEGKILEIDRRPNLTMDELKNYYIKKGIPVIIE